MRNKKTGWILGAMAAAAFAPAATAADAGDYAPVPTAQLQQLMLIGVVDGWVGGRSVTSTDDPDDSSHVTFGGDAHVNIPLGDRISTQFDIQTELHNDFGEEASQGVVMLGGHLSYRDPNQFLIGVFAGGGRPFADTLANDSPGTYSGVGYVAGAEGQIYFGNLTLYGQAGFGDFKVDDDGGPEGFVNGWFARAVGRYFFHDDFYVEGEYAYGYTNCFIDGTCAPSEDAGRFHNWGAKAVFRVHQGSPIYMTLAYQGGNYFATEDPDTGIEHSFRVGFRVLLGGNGAPTLLANDRYGATLDTPMLPARAASWVPGLD
jgi:hypothetical protein